MKKIYSLLICALLAMSVYAIPARKGLRTVKQPDGTELKIQLIGDEFFSFTATADSVPVIKTQTGAYVYAIMSNGIAVPTATMAHNKEQRQQAEIQLVANLKKQKIVPTAKSIKIREGVNNDNQQRAKQMRAKGPQKAAMEGPKNCLIILVQYPDQKMQHTQSEFQEMVSETNYSKNNHIGSLSDFFYDQSYGKLSVDFDVVGPYTLSQNMEYYGAHSEDGDNDIRPGDLISEAVHMAHDNGVNFSKYDWTGDGYVDQVFVIYAGYAEAQGGDATTIWPHKWSLSSAKAFKSGGDGPIKYDGVTIDTYACSSELRYNSGNKICGIGTAAHEFSHCLGLPDLYDTNYSGGTGMDDWSLMDSGGYRAEGDIPTPYTAQERAYIGWIELIELDKPMKVVNLPSIIEEPTAYIIYNEGKSSEYYILENHQQTLTDESFRNWDKSAPGHGMLVTHVDFLASAWQGNSVNNNPDHQRCIFIGADGRTTASAGSLYPGSKKNTSLTNTTTPAAKTYNANTDGKKFMNRPIESVTEHDGLIDFIFDGGVYVPIPNAKEATDVTSNGFTANWDAVEEALTYKLEVTEKGEATLLFYEDFAENENFTSVTKDGTEDISANLDNYLSTMGWTGKNLFLSAKKLKLGKSTDPGYIISPLYKAPTDGSVKIEVGVQKVSLSTAKFEVTLLDADGAELANEVITPDNVRHTFEFTDITKNFYIKFSTDKNRACIDFMAGYAAQNNDDANWTPIGEGRFSEMFFFSNAENIPCKFYQHKEKKNLYRIVNPYITFLKKNSYTPSIDASEYLYIELLQKGDKLADVEIDRDDLVLFYSDYDHSSFNTGYTHNTYKADICLVHPVIFTKYQNVEDWAQSRVLSKFSDGSPKRMHLAPMYYIWEQGGWDKTQESEDIIYVDFPEVSENARTVTTSINKNELNVSKTIEVEQQQVSTVFIKNADKPFYSPGQKIIAADLTGTSYTLSDLTENAIYTYRVKSINEEGESKWSNIVEVDLSQTLGISSIPASSLKTGILYDIHGRRVNKMEQGVYILDGRIVLK